MALELVKSPKFIKLPIFIYLRNNIRLFFFDGESNTSLKIFIRRIVRLQVLWQIWGSGTEMRFLHNYYFPHIWSGLCDEAAAAAAAGITNVMHSETKKFSRIKALHGIQIQEFGVCVYFEWTANNFDYTLSRIVYQTNLCNLLHFYFQFI